MSHDWAARVIAALYGELHLLGECRRGLSWYGPKDFPDFSAGLARFLRDPQYQTWIMRAVGRNDAVMEIRVTREAETDQSPTAQIPQAQTFQTSGVLGKQWFCGLRYLVVERPSYGGCVVSISHTEDNDATVKKTAKVRVKMVLVEEAIED